MKLRDKGSYAPAPHLDGPAEDVARELARWAEVHPRAHWLLGDESTIDGADFYLGQEELGHLHLDGEAHVAVGRALRDRLVGAKLAHPFRWSADFVTWRVESAADARRALWLFQLRYDALRGVPSQALVERIRGGPESSAGLS